MDTKKLRQKILDLAIHGKLVPQDPNDEPASVLLERIRAEKERLIAEGKIKRSKKSATSDTPHYENLPDGWVLTDIGELLTNRDSERIPLSLGVRSKQENKIYDYYGATGVVDKVDRYIFDGRLLLIGEDGANLLSRSKDNAFFAEGKYWVNNHAHILDCSEKEILNYVAFLINSMSLENYITGSAQPKLNQDNLNKIEIPLPPLEEQRRIIAQVNTWQSFITDLESSESELLESVETAKSKILDLAIHGKLVPQDDNDEPASELLKRINPKAIASCDNPQYGKVPSSWIISTVGEVFTINPKTHVEDDTEAAFVPMTCVSDGYSNIFEYECKKWGDIKKGFVHFQENDVAVAKISPCLENRKSVVFHDLPNGIGAGTTELNVFRCTEILPEYALFYFKSQMFIGSCAGTYNGVVGQQRVAKSFIQELPIGIPPYKEQLRIVSKVNDLFSQLDMIEKSLQA